MNKFYSFISEQGGFSETDVKRTFLTLLTLAVIIIISQLVNRIINKKITESKDAYQWRKSKNYIVFFVGILIMANIWGLKVRNFATYFGLLSAGLAIALKDPLTNIAAWILIISRRPFGITDRVQVRDVKGDVVDQRLFHFTIIEIGNWIDADQTTGRLIHIPNGTIFQNNISNYSSSFNFIWNEIPVLITFESNWKKAKNILQEIITKHGSGKAKTAQIEMKKASSKFAIPAKDTEPIVFTSVKDSGVMLSMRYVCEPRVRRISEQEIWEEVLREFEECKDIDFAYPTQRFYNNAKEGKDEARAN